MLETQGLKIPEKSLHIHLPQNIQRNLFQSNRNRLLVFLPSLPALPHHPNKRTRFQNVRVPRGPSYGASPAACRDVSGGMGASTRRSPCAHAWGGPSSELTPQSSWVQQSTAPPCFADV